MAGMNWCPRPLKLLIGARGVHFCPSRDVVSTMRASLAVANPRSAHARYTRPETSTAIVGYALVRKLKKVVPWSNGLIVATSSGVVKVCPPSVDLTSIIAAVTPSDLNRRQAAYTAPLAGSMAMVEPWFNALSPITAGLLHVLPQSCDRANRICEGG